MAASYTFEDLSGPPLPATGNPYANLITACNDDPQAIQSRYATHRLTRAAQQKALLLAPSFAGVTADATLSRLLHEPGFVDPRHCLVFWARPPAALQDLIAGIQRRLRDVVPRLWTMPRDCLHMTALEVVHSLTAEGVEGFVGGLRARARDVVDYPAGKTVRLVRPMVVYDAQAVAVGFLPHAEERYGYHHLRRDLYDLVSQAGVDVASRYVVPSAHLTIARFVDEGEWQTEKGFDHARMERLVGEIDKINRWLEEEYWVEDSEGNVKEGGEFRVGQGKGLDYRKGTLWYGGGETVMLGKGY